MASEIDKVLAIAEAEIGYLEKASNSQLDSKTANAGSNNYTKYARDLDAVSGFYNGKKQGYPWCDVFFDWVCTQALGVDRAKTVINHDTCGAGCEYSAKYYKDMDCWYTSPKKGDQIFFKDSGGSICHTGLVYSVSGSTITTIEGNTSNASGVVANGGGVAKKSYSTKYSLISGYGRPKYSDYNTSAVASSTVSKTKTYTTTSFNSGWIFQIPFSDIARIEYVPSKNLSSKKGELVTSAYTRLRYNGSAKPDFIFNAELFNSSDMSPASAVTNDGVIHYEREYWGISFVDHTTPTWSYKNNVNAKDFVGAYPYLLKSGVKYDYFPSEISGARARTAMAVKDGVLGIAIVPESPGTTPLALATKFKQLGYENAANFDGGGSTQAITPAGNLIVSRAVRGFVAIWLKSSGNTAGGTVTSVNVETSTSTSSTMQHDKTAAGGKAFYVNVNSYLNVRKDAGTSSNIIKQLQRNDKVYWYGYYKMVGSTKWLYVQYAPYSKLTVGFVSSAYLSETQV